MYHSCEFKKYTLTITLLLMFSEVSTGGAFSYSKCAKTQKNQMVANLKPQIVNKLKKCIVNNLKSHKNSKTQTVTKSKISICDKTKKFKL